MRTMTVEDIEAGFDAVIDQVQAGPVCVQMAGKDVAVLLSPDLYAFLLKQPPANVTSRVATLFKRSVVKRGKVYQALAEYEADHPEREND